MVCPLFLGGLSGSEVVHPDSGQFNHDEHTGDKSIMCRWEHLAAGIRGVNVEKREYVLPVVCGKGCHQKLKIN